MVELGNHQGRPPGNQCQPLSELNSDLNSASLSSSLLDHWINQDIASLEFLDGLCNQSNSRAGGSCLEEGTQALNVTFSGSVKDSIPASLKVPEADKLCQFYRQPPSEFQRILSLHQWGFAMDVDFLKLDEVFQVEQSDLVQSPTLAELNANKEPFFDLEFEDIQFDSSSFSYEIKRESPIPVACQNNANTLVAIEKTEKTEKMAAPFLSETVREKELIRMSEIREYPKEKLSVTEVTDYREIKKEPVVGTLLAIPGVSSRTRQRTYSNTTEISVVSSVSSNDEGFGSQAEDTDAEVQLCSDNESLACEEDSTDERTLSPCSGPSYRSVKQGSRKKRYFWQYNIQSKGPKGPRMTMNSARVSDPHILNDVTDPVFSAECHLEGVKHAGKARRGDGNDLTPNPRKLHNIGLELRSLNKMINDLSPACHSPCNMKPKSRKEKNKLASRCCRLKKKAQHEANKLKLFGLQQEHTKLMALMSEIKGFLREKRPSEIASRTCQQNLQKLLECRSLRPVAGHTAEYVNTVLDKVATGQTLTGLEDVNN